MRFDKYIEGTWRVTKERNWRKFSRWNKESLAEGRGCSRHSESVQGRWSGWNTVIGGSGYSGITRACVWEASSCLFERVVSPARTYGMRAHNCTYRITQWLFPGLPLCWRLERFIKGIQSSVLPTTATGLVFTQVCNFCIATSFKQNCIKGICFISLCNPWESNLWP